VPADVELELRRSRPQADDQHDQGEQRDETGMPVTGGEGDDHEDDRERPADRSTDDAGARVVTPVLPITHAASLGPVAATFRRARLDPWTSTAARLRTCSGWATSSGPLSFTVAGAGRSFVSRWTEAEDLARALVVASSQDGPT
jgi:hypothetical protein